MNWKALKRPLCWLLERGHDWRSGQMYSDGWTDTCHRCGKTREVTR